MIEDLGPVGVALIGTVVMIALLVWAKDRTPKHVNDETMGVLYMMYFWGAHSANQIVSEAIDSDCPRDRVREVWHAMMLLEGQDLIENEPPADLGWPSWDQHFVMTDKGEELYKQYARRFDMDYYEDTPLVEAGPARTKDVFS